MTDDHGAPEKQEKALQLVESGRLNGTGVVSTQVLQEYFVAATKKLGVAAAIARRKVELFARLDLVMIDLPDILGAIDLHRLHQLSFWDSLVVRAVQSSGCTRLYSEDLQDGSTFESVEIVNPFA